MSSEAHNLADTLMQRANANSPLGIAEMRAFSVMLRRIAVESDRMTNAINQIVENGWLDEREMPGHMRTISEVIAALPLVVIDGGKR